MSYIPNAREGENGYNDKDLKGERAAFLRGFDAAVEDILNIENNLEVYSGESLVMHYLEENTDKAAEIFTCLKEWAEMQRNEAAVSLLDDQFCEENDKEGEI